MLATTKQACLASQSWRRISLVMMMSLTAQAVNAARPRMVRNWAGSIAQARRVTFCRRPRNCITKMPGWKAPTAKSTRRAKNSSRARTQMSSVPRGLKVRERSTRLFNEDRVVERYHYLRYKKTNCYLVTQFNLNRSILISASKTSMKAIDRGSYKSNPSRTRAIYCLARSTLSCRETPRSRVKVCLRKHSTLTTSRMSTRTSWLRER